MPRGDGATAQNHFRREVFTVLCTIFIALDGRELYSCAAADMPQEEKRVTKLALARQFGIRPREIYIVDRWR